MVKREQSLRSTAESCALCMMCISTRPSLLSAVYLSLFHPFGVI
jgi:hypothetical protein